MSRSRRGRLLATGLLCTAVTVLPLTMGSVAEAAPAPVVSAADIAAATQDPEKLAALQAISDAMDQDPDHFAGAVTDGSSKVTINVVGDAASNRLAAVSAVRQQAEAKGIRTEVRYRKYSLRELTTLKDTIKEVEPFKSLGKDVVSWGVNTESNSVQVGVLTVKPELVDKVRVAFGDKVTLKQDTRDEAMSGRFTNLPNYLGGDRIRVGPPENATRCTSGFNIVNRAGLRYALTAGHCFDLNAEPVVDGNNAFFGTVQFRRYHDAVKIDMELVGVNVYRGGIFTGPAAGENLPQVPVTGSANSCRGCQVFFDGSFTGQALATIESAGDSQECRDIGDGLGGTYTACHLVTARGTNGFPCQGGDSGGPVFAFDGHGGVTAVGIITSRNDAEGVCRYTRIVPILAYWDASVYKVF